MQIYRHGTRPARTRRSEDPGKGGPQLKIAAAGLEYISSSGLRVLLRRQQQSDEKITILNASPEVYEIFSVTGFTKIMNVEKALRFVSIEGLE